MPVFVDSPLSANVTDVFREHPECFDREARQYTDDDLDPFGFTRLTFIRDVEASRALNHLQVPCIIIAASGMCEAGRVLHHLKRIAPDPRSSILIVGFMAEHTLGRRIAAQEPMVKIFGEQYPLRARVESIEGLSAHADRDELLAFLGRLDHPPEHTFVVHGEEAAACAFAEALRERGHPQVEVPRAGEAFEV